jgi:hypothetical protein
MTIPMQSETKQQFCQWFGNIPENVPTCGGPTIGVAGRRGAEEKGFYGHAYTVRMTYSYISTPVASAIFRHRAIVCSNCSNVSD